MLDYIECGIFDALERHYLKSFIFLVYLVSISVVLLYYARSTGERPGQGGAYKVSEGLRSIGTVT